MLLLSGIEDDDRVAVGDFHDGAFNGSGKSNRWKEKEEIEGECDDVYVDSYTIIYWMPLTELPQKTMAD